MDMMVVARMESKTWVGMEMLCDETKNPPHGSYKYHSRRRDLH